MTPFIAEWYASDLARAAAPDEMAVALGRYRLFGVDPPARLQMGPAAARAAARRLTQFLGHMLARRPDPYAMDDFAQGLFLALLDCRAALLEIETTDPAAAPPLAAALDRLDAHAREHYADAVRQHNRDHYQLPLAIGRPWWLY